MSRPVGFKCSPETVEKMRRANSNPSPETREKLRVAATARWPSVKDKMRGRSGWHHSTQAKERISRACRLRVGEKNNGWKGGKHVTPSGYVMVLRPRHPGANSNGYVLEHRLVMEKILGRPLLASEIVHHRNQIKDDNRPENLEIVIRKAHCGSVTCPHCQKHFLIK